MKYVFQIIILLNLFVPAIAQKKLKVVGEGKFLPGELIDQSIRDINGEIAAGLRIVTDLKGFAFEARNGVVKLNSKPGEYFLFLQPSERVVRILSIGYVPLEIYLYDYGIHLRSGQTWELTITGDKELSLLPVNIIVKPDDATLEVDNEKKVAPYRSLTLESGKHQIKIYKENYKQ